MQLSEGGPTQTVPKDEEPVASCVPHCYTQDVSLACRLPPGGAYTIVPSTYQPDCSASFTLSLACKIHRLALLSWSLFDQCSIVWPQSLRLWSLSLLTLNSRSCDLLVFCRKVVKSQERLGRAIQEVSLLVTPKNCSLQCIYGLCGQKMAALANHCVCVSLFVSHPRGGRPLTSLWCKANCSVDVAQPPFASWRTMKEPVRPSTFTQRWFVCVCVRMHVSIDQQLLRRQTGRRCGNMCRESRKPLYPEPPRLWADGQSHTHGRLEHQRLSLGWAANEVWRDRLV